MPTGFKYIARIRGKNGKWRYIYKDSKTESGDKNEGEESSGSKKSKQKFDPWRKLTPTPNFRKSNDTAAKKAGHDLTGQYNRRTKAGDVLPDNRAAKHVPSAKIRKPKLKPTSHVVKNRERSKEQHSPNFRKADKLPDNRILTRIKRKRNRRNASYKEGHRP